MRRAHRPALAIVGHLSLDDIRAQKVWHRTVPGGSVVYAALAARLGSVLPQVFAVAGSDYPSSFVSTLAMVGIETSGIRRSSAPQRRAVFRYDRAERRSTAAADDSWLKDSERTAPQMPERGIDADGFLLCAAGPLIQADWARHARKLNRPVFLDTSDPYVRVNAGQLSAAIRDVDFFLPSESQLRLMLPDSTLAEAMRLVSQLGPPVVVVKRGPSGAAVYEREGDRYAEYPGSRVRAKDPTGAGDAFCGAFAAAWLGTRELATALAWGMAAGRLVVGGVGSDCLLRFGGSLAKLAEDLNLVPDV